MYCVWQVVKTKTIILNNPIHFTVIYISVRSHTTLIYFSFHGASDLSWPWPPHFPGYTITLRHTTVVGLLWTSNQPVALTLPDSTQHSQEKNILSPSGIRTRNPSQRVTADPGLRPRGHWHRFWYPTLFGGFTFLYNARWWTITAEKCSMPNTNYSLSISVVIFGNVFNLLTVNNCRRQWTVIKYVLKKSHVNGIN